ncbi:CIA30-domain-containing protein [Dacryopinax primogenitus]|uniref:CIA30-domain-containing protein n=1 Tax=Dacryopinax primogenitus (strain DJM 731) TaxID=1858805 RepID=M5GG28_DACPD|nr:CIA30-domain-containing protein [Dacryopinax primogenitus]EJU04763.1 CIA30-domain-containing protein [Dacryopinax primogenitus]
MSRIREYLRRSLAVAQDGIARTIAADPAPPRLPLPMFTIHSQEDLEQFATGCDADIGGYSTCHLELDSESRGRFYGNMNTSVHPSLAGKMNSGYAAFRSKKRTSLFGEMFFDVGRLKYLHLRVKAGGDRRTQDAYFVNIQTETPVTSDIWQHRLFLREHGAWEDVLIPFRSFVLTNYGQPVPGKMEMNTEKVRTVGISILGGKFGIDGKYELGIDSISAINEPPQAPPRISAADFAASLPAQEEMKVSALGELLRTAATLQITETELMAALTEEERVVLSRAVNARIGMEKSGEKGGKEEKGRNSREEKMLLRAAARLARERMKRELGTVAPAPQAKQAAEECVNARLAPETPSEEEKKL